LNKDQTIEVDLNERTAECLAKVTSEFMSAEVPPETIVDEEFK
jgi:hypothetical protein